MPERKIIYQNWIVDISCNPSTDNRFNPGKAVFRPNKRVIKAVWRALSMLTKTERDFIKQYYFKGESDEQIALILGEKTKCLNAIHRRAIAKLKKYLSVFVKDEFGLDLEQISKCPLCNSPDLVQINILIRKKSKKETWGALMGQLEEKYNISVKTPQILIGHQKYHML